MTEKIQKYEQQHPELWDAKKNQPVLAANGRPVRSTREQVLKILVPMFAMFPNAKTSDMMVAQYVRLLNDISPERLQQAVDETLKTSEWLPTVAAIRKAYEAGISVENQSKMYDIDNLPERTLPRKYGQRETRAERMEQLRRYKSDRKV